MDDATPQIDVRAVHINDAPALYQLDYSFETDRIYTLRVQNRLLPDKNSAGAAPTAESLVFSFELLEIAVDPPIYKNYWEREDTLEAVEAALHNTEGGYVALANGAVAGGILLDVEEWRSVVRIQE